VSRARTATLLGALLIPVALIAQSPDATIADQMSGTWVLDQDRSDPLPALASAAAEPQRPDPGAPVAGATAGGGGRGRRGGGGSGASGSQPQGLGARRGGSAGMRNPYVRTLLTQLAVPAEMDFAAGSDRVSITVGEVSVQWTPDGRKHQEAQMDGTLLQNTATWKGEKLQLVDGVEGAAELKREIKLIDDGQALEIKLQLGGPSFPKKLSRKVVYVKK